MSRAEWEAGPREEAEQEQDQLRLLLRQDREAVDGDEQYDLLGSQRWVYGNWCIP